MNYERIAQYDDGKGLTVSEALKEAKMKHLTIPSSKELSQRLVFSNQWESEKEVYPCLSGTLAIYEAPDKPFGETVEFDGLTAKIPKKFQGKANMVILCNHPDFSLKGNTFTLGKSAKLIQMPKTNGWYNTDAVFEYPTGEKKDRADERRYLWRRSNCWIGLVSRFYYGIFSNGRRDVLCGDGSYFRFGVLAKPNKTHKHKFKKVCELCGVER